MKVWAKRDDEIVAEITLGHQPLFIGRFPENDIVLSHPDISRRHTKLTLEEGKVHVEDLESSNGTKIDGEKITKATLSSGDQFQVGPFVIELEAEEKPVESDDDSFVRAIAVRPASEPEEPDPLKVLNSFLTEEPSTPSSARLVHLDGDDEGEAVPLAKDSTTLGKASDNDVVLPDQEAEEKQASIAKESDGFVVRDGNESTGTFIDGVPVRERVLENHDMLQVGGARFEYVEDGSRSEAEGEGDFPEPRKRAWLFSGWRVGALAGVLAGGTFIAFLLSQEPPPPPRKSTPVPKAQATPTSTPSEDQKETTRLALHHLKIAKELVSKDRLTDADERLDILEKIVPNHKGATEIREQIAEIRAKRKATAKKEADRVQKRNKKIADLLAKGKKALRAKAFPKAREAYEKVLEIDSENTKALEGLKQTRGAEKETERTRLARKKEQEQLKRIFTAGVTKYEEGRVGEAETLLKEVAAKKGPYQKSAKKILKEIHSRTDEKLKAKIANADQMLNIGDLLDGYEEIRKLSKQFPKHKGVAKIFKKAKKKMRAKAQALYQEGRAQQELAEDPAAALDMYQEALKYAPDPKSEYHLKAKKRIDELQL